MRVRHAKHAQTQLLEPTWMSTVTVSIKRAFFVLAVEIHSEMIYMM